MLRCPWASASRRWTSASRPVAPSRRPEDMNCPLPRDFFDDSNLKAAYRFEHGLIV